MDKIESIGKTIKDFFSKNEKSKTKIIVIFGITGIMLLFFSELLPEEKNIKQNEDIMNFCENEIALEKRVEKAVKQIKGAGKTEVTLTFDSSKEYYYAKNTSESTDGSEKENDYEFVIYDGKNGEEPLLIKSCEPEIRGVLVVCEGGNEPLIKEKIIEAVCALLDIPSNKVSVAEMA